MPLVFDVDTVFFRSFARPFAFNQAIASLSNFGLRFRLRRLTAMRGIMFQFCLIAHASEVEIDALEGTTTIRDVNGYTTTLEGSWEGEQPGDCDGGLWPELEFEMGRYL